MRLLLIHITSTIILKRILLKVHTLSSLHTVRMRMCCCC
jgi:hypothetical protein